MDEHPYIPVAAQSQDSVHAQIWKPAEKVSTRQLVATAFCLAGVQFAWTVEFAYGTPFLVSLGLSKPLTALVWLAGPLSGLIVQPLIGIYSDHSHHRMGRRRPILMAAGSLVLVAIALIAYCEKLAGLVSDKSNYKSACIIIAVIAFYLLDFSINAFMASSRALIVDSAETSQQGDANAWAGRMLGVGNLFGYFVGNLNLVKIFPWIGDTQLRVLCIFAISFFILTTAITCFGTTEIPLSPEPEGALSQNHTFSERFAELLAKIRKLPITVRQICFVQLFAWLGWFPFLFYASSWVSAIASKDLALDLGIRCGSFALLMFAIVSSISGFILPLLHSRFTPSFPLSKIWGFSLILFGVLLFLPFMFHQVWSATVIIAVIGVPWSITLWAPFSLLGEWVSHQMNIKTIGIVNSQIDINANTGPKNSLIDAQTDINMILGPNNDLISAQMDVNIEAQKPMEAGMILGIHNISIVLPQILSTFVCSFLFSVYDSVYFQGTSGFEPAWMAYAFVFGFGGAASIVAGVFASMMGNSDGDEKFDD